MISERYKFSSGEVVFTIFYAGPPNVVSIQRLQEIFCKTLNLMTHLRPAEQAGSERRIQSANFILTREPKFLLRSDNEGNLASYT